MQFKNKIISALDENELVIKSREGTPIAYLDLIGAVDLQDKYLIEKITYWRRRFKQCFLSEFQPTCERTKAWMQKAIVNDPDRALFKILNPDKMLLGHIGAIHRNTYIEYDYFILGVKLDVKHFALSVASQFLLWILSLTDMKLISGKVRSDNFHGLDFHRRTGFSEYRKIPLKRIETEHGEVRFEEAASNARPNLYLVEIRATADDLIAADFRQNRRAD